mmetsp:Transcript_47695/g.149365  ORF Transcript_47695/g.149365 Transcript_47695/m.149365 type:complete len:253 (+) Transcript_47695:2-760(+)
MRQQTNRTEVDIDYNTEPSATAPPAAAPVQASLMDDLNVLFSRDMAGSSIALMLMSYTLNSFLIGHGYAFPLIATNAGISDLQPGYQGLIQTLLTLLVALLAVPACFVFSLRFLSTLGLASGVVGPILFAWSGTIKHRAGVEVLAFNFGQVAPYICCVFGFITCNQLGVELYPPQVASTFLGLIIGVGNIGAIAAPFMFAYFDYWPHFYLFLASLSAVSLVAALSLLRFQKSEGPASGQALGAARNTNKDKT